VAAGPLADGQIVLTAVAVVSELPPTVVPSSSVLGGVFLHYLAVTNAVGAQRATLPSSSGPRARGRGGLVTGLIARTLSPHPYLFWFLVGGPTLAEARNPSWAAVAAFLVGYATIVGSNIGLALHRWMGLLSIAESSSSPVPCLRCPALFWSAVETPSAASAADRPNPLDSSALPVRARRSNSRRLSTAGTARSCRCRAHPPASPGDRHLW
jgi:hypothetical protein